MKVLTRSLVFLLGSSLALGQSTGLATRAPTPPRVPMVTQYQTNSALAYASIDGQQNHMGMSPIGVLRWLKEPSVVELQTSAPETVRLLALSSRPVVSRTEGAWVTPGGQLFNLDLGDPSLRYVDLSDLGSTFTIQPAKPLAVAMQLIVLTPAHPDGFVLSAPIDLRYQYAQGQSFELRSVDPTRLDEVPIRVMGTPTVTGSLGPYDSTASVGATTTGTVSLEMEGSPALTTRVSVDNVTGVLSVDAGIVHTLHDLFPGMAPTSATAKVTMDFEHPLTLDVGGIQPIVAVPKTYVTDKGCAVATSCDGYPRCPDMTQAEADAALCSVGLKGMVTQTMPPSDGYDCHGYTFTCGAKWINDDQVAKILADNGYTAKSSDSGGVSPGDIVVYRDPMGNVKHSGVVTKVDSNGNPTEIESKWGRSAKYKHAPGTVPGFYGTPTYYCTTRCLGNKLKCKSASSTGGG